MFSFNGISQTLNNVTLKDIYLDYVQIIETAKLFIQIDFGQNTKFFSTRGETILKDKEGKRMDFNSMIDALNFMSKSGFEFVKAYTVTIGNQNVYHYILNKIK